MMQIGRRLWIEIQVLLICHPHTLNAVFTNSNLEERYIWKYFKDGQ